MKWLTRLVIAGVFLFGAVAGLPLGMKIERDRFLKLQKESTAALTGRAFERIAQEVSLSEGQREQLREVLERARPLIDAVENDRRQRVVQIMEDVRNNAVAFMDASQKVRYDVLHEKLKNRFVASGLAAVAVTAAIGVL